MVSVRESPKGYISCSLPKAFPLLIPLKTRLFQKKVPYKHHDDNVLYSKAQAGDHVRDFRRYDDIEVPPIPGRAHVPVQTDIYLEEICDIIEENDIDCQTDPFLDRPPSPLFVPAKTGVDVETQTCPAELFDFDREVQPLLESLVGQTIEQSIIEIMREEEIAQLEDNQEIFQARRNAELAECLRLEEQERRLLEERKQRLKEQEEAVKLEEETTQKVAACVFAQNYLSDLLPSVYKRLESQGYFATHDPDIQEVEEVFWPWLMEEVDSEINTLETSCCILDTLIEDAVQTISENAVIRPVTPDSYPERPVSPPTETKEENAENLEGEKPLVSETEQVSEPDQEAKQVGEQAEKAAD